MASAVTSKEQFLSHFKIFEQSLNGESSSPVHSLREDALSKFSELDFPSRHHEDWKYTSISPITDTLFTLAQHGNHRSITTDKIKDQILSNDDCYCLAFINNNFSANLSSQSLPKYILLRPLTATLKSEPEQIQEYLTRCTQSQTDIFTTLNTAFIKEGACVIVPDNVIIDKPIQLIFLTSSDEKIITHPRNLIVLGKNSQATIIESYLSMQQTVYFTNSVSEIIVGENSHLHHTKVQNESESAFHVASTFLHQNRYSSVTTNLISFGGALVRNNVNSVLDGTGAFCTLNGLYMVHNKQHVDNHTVIDHAKPNCESHELYKGILDDESRGVFNGKIIVRHDAQKTDAKQQNKNLLLSDNASIDTKPQLEIFANDVKCTHGATVGQLDDDQLFYLRARGIRRDDAENILTHAFAREVINRITVEPLREQLENQLTQKFEKN